MAQQLGTGWMIPPPRRQDDDAAFTQLIDKMDLEQVKRYMCPKSSGNPLKCMNCEGFRTCTAGQRAVRLTDEATRATEQKTAPDFVKKWTADEGEKVSNNPTSIEREEFKRACESGNAWNFLMETRKISKDAAGELLSRLIRRYPGVAADYGGGRRIMQRPKVVKITGVMTENDAQAPVAARVEQEQASAPKVEQKEIPEEQEAEQAENRRKREENAYNRQQMEKAREKFRKAIESGDSVQFLIDEEGIAEETARNRIKKWIEKYPDLCEGFEFEKRKRGRKKKAPEVTETAEAEKPETAESDDEISLEDFLGEFQFDETEADRKEAELQTEAFMIPAKAIINALNQPQETQEMPKNSDPMLEQMNARYEALTAEKERLRAEIEKAEERIKCIEQQQSALERCLSAFLK